MPVQDLLLIFATIYIYNVILSARFKEVLDLSRKPCQEEK